MTYLLWESVWYWTLWGILPSNITILFSLLSIEKFSFSIFKIVLALQVVKYRMAVKKLSYVLSVWYLDSLLSISLKFKFTRASRGAATSKSLSIGTICS